MNNEILSFRYSEQYKNEYLVQLNHYLDEELIYCQENPNGYSKVTMPYIKEIKENIAPLLMVQPTNSIANAYKNRDFKYNNFVEAYRLIKYQYSKYSNINKSLVEGVYSSIVLEILKHSPKDVKNVLDCGCGPSRLTYELSSFYNEACFTLVDFSYINLFFANKLMSGKSEFNIPTKAFGNDDIENLTIKTKNIDNINSYIFNLDSLDASSFDHKFDIITASHSINLLTDPLKTINVMSQLMNNGGLLVISDLLGWKENRDNSRRIFYNKQNFFNKISNIPDLKVLHKESGGPYCEDVNDERYDIYTNHFIVLRKEI